MIYKGHALDYSMPKSEWIGCGLVLIVIAGFVFVGQFL